NVPPPFFTTPPVLAITQLIVAVTHGSTVIAGPLMVSVEPLSTYPLVLKLRLLTLCADDSVTVPAVPQKIASSPPAPPAHATSLLALYHLAAVAFHVPLPPNPAPLLR